MIYWIRLIFGLALGLIALVMACTGVGTPFAFCILYAILVFILPSDVYASRR